jgi:hypothetical protein
MRRVTSQFGEAPQHSAGATIFWKLRLRAAVVRSYLVTMNLRSLLFTCLAASLTAVGFAQPSSVTFRPALIDTFASSYSYSGAGDFKRGATKIDGISMTRFEFSASGRVPIAEGMLFNPGVAYSHTTIETPDNTPLPKTVQEFSVNLGVRGLFSKEWAYLVALRPGLYGDFEKIGSDSFNAPLFLAAFYVPNPSITWIFGVTANAFNDHPVLPVLGLRLKVAQDLQLDIGFPRTGLSYALNSDLTLRGGLSAFGGNYRITKNLGVPAPGVQSINNTFLDVTEIRGGIGATYKIASNLEIEADFGYTAMRRFEFPDRDYRLRGDNVTWVSFALNTRF